MNKESLEKMTRMRLLGMHHAFKNCIDANQTDAYTNDELVHHLVHSEWDDRQHRAVQRNLKNANFRYSASIEQLDYSEERGLDKIRYNAWQHVILLEREKICLLQEVPVQERVF
jgi:DNA replication protein DnaC